MLNVRQFISHAQLDEIPSLPFFLSCGAPLVGKQRFEKLMMARPPGLRTRCISLKTSKGFAR